MSQSELTHIINRANNAIQDVHYLLSVPTNKAGRATQSFRAIVAIVNLMAILKDISDHKNDFNIAHHEEHDAITKQALLILGPGGVPPEPIFQDIVPKIQSMHNLIQNLYRVYEIDIEHLNTLTSIDPAIVPAKNIASFEIKKDSKNGKKSCRKCHGDEDILGEWVINETNGFGLDEDEEEDEEDEEEEEEEEPATGGGGRRRTSRKHLRRRRRRTTRKNI